MHLLPSQLRCQDVPGESRRALSLSVTSDLIGPGWLRAVSGFKRRGIGTCVGPNRNLNASSIGASLYPRSQA
eukprot:3100916-Rhodomonas_salina.4